MMSVRPLSCVVALLLVGACAGDDTKGRIPLAGDAAQGNAAAANGAPAPGALPPGMTPLSAALLDSGNVAFRLKQYTVAQRYYEQAAAAVPTQAAPWYGVYMVAQAIKSPALADSAMKMVGQRSGGSDLMAQDVGKTHEAGKSAR